MVDAATEQGMPGWQPSRRKYVIRDAHVIAAFMGLLLLQTTTLINFAIGSGGPINVVKTLALGPLILLVIWYHRHSIRGMLAMPELTALIALAAASYFWTVAPYRFSSAITVQVVLALSAMTLGSMLSMRGLLYALGFLLAACVVVSLLSIGAIPAARGVGAGSWEGTWRGIFAHKNGFGSAMSLALVLALSLLPITEKRWRAPLIALAVLATFLLVQSASRSSQSVVVVAVAGLAAAGIMRHRPRFWAVCFLSSIVALLLLGTFVLASPIADPIFEFLGRKPTLSGRIPLWSLSMEAIAERPWLGHGFFSFWDQDAKRVLYIARDPTVRHVPFYSHNGAVETLLNLGIVGLVVVGLVFLRTIASFFRVLAATGQGPICVAYLTLVAVFFLSNVLEAPVLSRGALTWVIFMTVATRLSLTARSLSNSGRRTRQHPLPRGGPG